MTRNKIGKVLVISALSSVAFAAASYASLAPFQSYNGKFGMSTDGFGSTSNVGVISASAPSGSVVKAAYLYSATYDFSGNVTPAPTTVTLNGVTVNYSATQPNATACCGISSHRADVTSIVKSIIDSGSGGVYDFNINEGSNPLIDGEALVVVYENPSLTESTIGILDGFASVTGDQTSINFADPLDPASPGFFAEMYLGIGFSCCGSQKSRIEVNDQLLTENAGNSDDGAQATSNGSLITVGGFDDPFSPTNPTYDNDREKYDLVPYLSLGDTAIKIVTSNSSRDDNIFFAGFRVKGRAGIDEPPPPPPSAVPLPAAIWLLGGAVAGLGVAGKRRSKKQ